MPADSDPGLDSKPRGLFGRAKAAIAYLNANRKRLFWYWIAYQCIKGITTLSLIWIPLLLVWLRSRGEG